MLIGSKETFAAEIQLHKEHSALLEGTFSYWINSDRLGGDVTIYLSDVLMDMPWKIHDAGNRLWQGDPAADPEGIFRRLYHDIYDSEDFEDCPARYDISVNVSGIGSYRVFCLEDDCRGYLLYNRLSDDKVIISAIEKGEADRVLKAAYQWLDDLYNREHDISRK